jgi:hypothetical protein
MLTFKIFQDELDILAEKQEICLLEALNGKEDLLTIFSEIFIQVLDGN